MNDSICKIKRIILLLINIEKNNKLSLSLSYIIIWHDNCTNKNSEITVTLSGHSWLKQVWTVQ